MRSTLSGRSGSTTLARLMSAVADGDGRSSFAFAVPVRKGWTDQLATITLAGPRGAVTLDRDTDRPMTILRDPATGQVRGILRNPLGLAVAEADALAELAPRQGVEVLYSRLPSIASERR